MRKIVECLKFECDIDLGVIKASYFRQSPAILQQPRPSVISLFGASSRLSFNRAQTLPHFELCKITELGLEQAQMLLQKSI